MIFKTMAFAGLSTAFVFVFGHLQPVASGPSINDMQSCQALLDFTQDKLKNGPQGYLADDVKYAQDSLEAYNNYIQDTIITPGLLGYADGDAGKTAALLEEIDAFKTQLLVAYQAKYPDNEIPADIIVSLNNCSSKVAPQGAALSALTTTMERMLAISAKS